MGPTNGGTAESWLELDERLYHLDEMERDFLSKHMSIQEPQKLKEHIFSSQAQVYKVKSSKNRYHIPHIKANPHGRFIRTLAFASSHSPSIIFKFNYQPRLTSDPCEQAKNMSLACI